MRRSDFFKMHSQLRSYKEVPGYIRSGVPLCTQKQNIFEQNKNNAAHNVLEVNFVPLELITEYLK